MANPTFRFVLLALTLAMPVIHVPALASSECGQVEPRSTDKLVVIEESADGSLRESGRRETISERMAFHQVPALSVAVVDNGKPQESQVYGYCATDVEGKDKLKATPQTRFQAASVSKFVTAVATHILVSQGKLELDEDVNRYLKRWQVPQNPLTANDPVTLRLLLSHQSGLPSTSFEHDESGRSPTLADVLEGRLPAMNDPALPACAPGEKWMYSNLGYAVIQMVLEDTLGKPFDSICHELVFDPLGMAHSSFDWPPPQGAKGGEAMPHNARGETGEPDIDSPAKAQGGLMTTSHDLARLVAEVMLAAKGKSTVLPQAVADNLLHPQTDLPFTLYNQRTRMGLGALLLGEGDDLAFFHNGYNTPGSVCMVIGWPAIGEGLAIMANGSNGEALYIEALATLAEAHHWPAKNYFTSPEEKAGK